ncbi:hypothetical protein GOP47_0007197 [Adiantum capillus-veneris]|uniref:Uncharacterized protein n=1 Tax=Adiantum capillus-veneris TaxID=13818 RepID=A0A9D4V145_ADICA|nr:hypothetical protein GOP47_0007197 [Adiantum capillus-veneris]
MGSSPLMRLEFPSGCAAHKTQVGFLSRGLPSAGFRSSRSRNTVFVRASKGAGGKKSNRGSAKAATKKKESPWIDADNDSQSTISSKSRRTARSRSSRSSKSQTKSSPAPAPAQGDSRILVSGIMPVEVEEVLQTGEPALTPSWQTFVSSLCGVWRGVGAAFSPVTAEMEAIALGIQDEMLYDSRILSTIEECKGTGMSQIERKTVWAVGNPSGEQGQETLRVQEPFLLPQEIPDNTDGNRLMMEDIEDLGVELLEDGTLEFMDSTSQSRKASSESITSDLESPDLVYDTVMEEDVLELEPGLVYFEDGAYSRGPLTLLDGDSDGLTSPSFKIEQCLVRGGHTRLRLVHTIAVEENGESIQLLRVAVYNEEWMGPHNMKSISDSGGHHLKLFSQHARLKPQELIGSWKVFELSATAVLADNVEAGESNQRPPYVYMTTETKKRRLLPELPLHFSDEDIMDMQDVTVMWLPGGISAYVDVKDDGMLTVGVGWYENGVNLVMERDYNTEGNLIEVHNKSEVKGGWVGGRM